MQKNKVTLFGKQRICIANVNVIKYPRLYKLNLNGGYQPINAQKQNRTKNMNIKSLKQFLNFLLLRNRYKFIKNTKIGNDK